VKILVCPSAPPSRMDAGTATSTPPGTWQAAVSDYTPTTRIAQGAIDAGLVAPAPADINGPLVTNKRISVSDVLDGASNKIMMAEDAGRPQLWRVGKLINSQASDTAAGWADRNNLIA